MSLLCLSSQVEKINLQKRWLILTSGLKFVLAMARITVLGPQEIDQADISEQCRKLTTGIPTDLIRSEYCECSYLPTQVLPESDAIGVVDAACMQCRRLHTTLGQVGRSCR